VHIRLIKKHQEIYFFYFGIYISQFYPHLQNSPSGFMSAAWFPGVFKRTRGLPVPHFMPSQRILGSVGIVHFSMGAGGYCFMFYCVYVHCM